MVRRAAVVAALASLTVLAAWFGIGAGSAGADDRRMEGWGRPVSSLAQAEQLADTDRAMVLVGEEVRGTFVDVAAQGESPGDMFIFEQRLYNRSQTNVVGKLSVRCQLGLRTYMCDGTFRLNDRGKIVISAALFPADRGITLAVTGGTGEFKPVGGALQVYDVRGGKNLYVLKLVR